MEYYPCTKRGEVDDILNEARRNPATLTQEKLIRVMEFVYFMTPSKLRAEDFVLAAHVATQNFSQK